MTTTQPSNPLAASYASYVVRVHTRNGIRTLSFDALAAYFTCTSKQAAEDLGISSRTLIRVCRSLGIRRWPYLGFRSEMDIARIRHEAIANLRRRLESGGGAKASIESPSVFARRGASASRLLQLKASAPIRPRLSAFFGNASYSDMTDASMTEDGDATDSCGGHSDSGGFEHSPQHATPPHVLSLNPQRLSPRKGGAGVVPSLRSVFQTPPGQEQLCDRGLKWSPDQCVRRCPPLRTRAMSMHDILSASSTPPPL